MQQRRVFNKDVIKTINGFADDNMDVGKFEIWAKGQPIEDQIEILIGLLNFGRKYNEDIEYHRAMADASITKEASEIVELSRMVVDGKIMQFDRRKLEAFKENTKVLPGALVAGFLYYGRNDNRKKFYPDYAPETKSKSLWTRIFG